ncbi:MAG: undecaprenyl/decaprenyl-phosphate alpha-N-acetylglucosaminyl 1-phosphate transferase [Deltaproteobacteria bacterium]|nr:undecaprenyl/decaprenyl-phosphate alpha-N-acetylglucosaminyl 1-phosphate transferase [Deltaproteobacteria bacterium]
MLYFSTLFLSLFVSMALMPLSRRFCVRIGAVDTPGGRKLHDSAVPRSGGIAMAIGVLVPVVLWASPDAFVKAVLLGAGVVFVCGFADDIQPLGWKVKFASQLVAALIVVLYGGVEIKNLGLLLPPGRVLPAAIAFPLSVFFIVGITNAINLSDGLDGLAGGICLLAFCCIGYLGYMTDNLSVILISVAAVGAVFGFLRFNTYPATLFMGDAGSQFLGFLAGCLTLRLTQGGSALSPLLPLLILGFPILDTLVVMAERIAAGQSPFHADNRHFHHRLMRLGLYHTEAVMIIYLLQAILVTAAFLLRFHSEWLILWSYLLFTALVVAVFLVADKTGFQVKRYHLFDSLIKGKLKVLREKAVLIRVAYRAAVILLPAVLIISCAMAAQFPSYFSYLSFGLLLVVLACFRTREGWASGATRLALYLLIPAVIYLSDGAGVPEWLNGLFLRFYNLAFGFVALFVFLTLKFTRRRKGFKVTPMDILILFVAVVLPLLPDPRIQGQRMGFIIAKVTLLFFSYEVLLGEMRGNVRGVAVTTMVALAVFGVKGLI